MKKYYLLPLLLLLACLTIPLSPTAAPDAPIRHEDTLSLLQAGDFPLPAPLPEGTDELMLFRTGGDLSGASEAIRTGLLSMSEKIELSEFQLTTEDLKTVLQDLINGYPELFHINKKYSYNTYNTSGLVAHLLPSYNCTVEEYAARSAVYEQALNDLLAQNDPTWSPVESVIFYHDYLALNFSYDTTEPFNYDAYTFFAEGTGVCQAYTLTFTALMNRLGIPVAYAQSEEMVHIWNLVSIDGEWYHLDATWDDPLPDYPGQVLHKLLLRSDAAISDESMAESRHYNWTAQSGITCTSTRFDDAQWQGVSTALVPSETGWYGIDRTSGAISSFDPINGNALTTLHTVTEQWQTAAGSVYVNKFVGLALRDELLYFNTPYAVFCLDPESGACSEIFTPSNLEGSIFGLYRIGNTLYYLTAPEYGTAPTIVPLPTPDMTMPIHLYGKDGFLGSFDTISRATAAMNDPTCAYTIALLPSRAGDVIPFNLLNIPEGVAASLRIRPLMGTSPVTLAFGTTASFGCDVILENMTLISSATSTGLAIGSHSFTLSGSTALGTDAAPLSITGDGYSSLILHGEQDTISFTGSAIVGTLDLRGELTLRGNLNATTFNIPAASTIHFPKNGSSLTAVDIIGSNELTLVPTCTLPPRISLSGIVDILLCYHYAASFERLPLLTAPGLPTEDLEICIEYEEMLIELTPLFSVDGTGTLSRVLESRMTVEDGRLISYLSAIPSDRVVIPASVTTIGAYAFGNCPNVTSVLIPQTVTAIESYGVGYLYMDGTPILHTSLTLRAEEHSAASAYAEGNSLRCEIYHMETESEFTYRHYPALQLIELLAWHGSQSTLIIPASLTAHDGSICATTVDADLTAGRTNLTIFSPFSLASSRCPYDSVWATTHTYYPAGTWYTLTLMMDDTVLRTLPLPTTVSLDDELFIPVKPGEAGGTGYLFLGWDMDADAIPDEVPPTLTADLTLHAVFAPLAADQYLIAWYDYDGTLLSMQALTAGSPITPPEAPLREQTVSHSYTFLSWSGFTEGMIAQASVSFTALYEETPRTYAYSFLDFDGTLLHTVTAEYGAQIILPIAPIRPSDEQYQYSFSHWQGYEKNMILSGDVSFRAVYIATDRLAPHPTDITSDHYPIVFGYISRIDPATHALTFLSFLNESEFVVITDIQGNPVGDEQFIGTGMTVTLLAADGVTPLKTLTTVVTGDLSGDGAVSITDFIQLKAHLLGTELLAGAKSEAADLTGDDTVSLTDFIQMKARLLAAASIDE